MKKDKLVLLTGLNFQEQRTAQVIPESYSSLNVKNVHTIQITWLHIDLHEIYNS